MIYITSDQHFYHERIIFYSGRPYSSVEEMNEALIRNFNAKVGVDDITYHLGDVAMQEKYVQPYISRLNGTHILIAGNHDLCHPANRRRKKGDTIEAATQRYIDYGFKEVHMQLELDGFLLHHLPFSDAEDARLTEYRPKRNGDQILLCGHVHSRWKYQTGPSLMINVGCDVWDYAPVSLDELRSFISGIGY